MKAQKVSLPYVNNALAVLATVVVNLGVVFLFNWPGGITYPGVLLDSVICAAITTAIDMCIVYPRMKKMRAAGSLPTQVPVSAFMQRLPRNPLALGVVYLLVFGALTVGANALVLWFFGVRDMAFVPWLSYKLLYSTVLSAKITEYIVFRCVQPDWASAAGGAAKTQADAAAVPVKNPLPKISVFKEMYASVTGNIAMNIIIGTALGGVVIAEGGAVVIHPTTVQGIPITGLVFGLIVGVLVTNGVVNEINRAILAPARGAKPAGQLPPPDKRFTWMPKRKIPLMCLVCACMMLFSSVALWVIMKLLGLSVMNFYQFTVFITVYASVVSKPLSYVLTRRCTQPDYIGCVLQSAGQL